MPTPLIVYGNPCDGIAIIGPFETTREAEQWARENLDNSDGDHFWSTPLYSPGEFMKNNPERVKPKPSGHEPGRAYIRTLRKRA